MGHGAERATRRFTRIRRHKLRGINARVGRMDVVGEVAASPANRLRELTLTGRPEARGAQSAR